MKLLSIVFSFRNEEKNIPDLIDRVVKTLDKLSDWKYELIFVNDDSDDESEQILKKNQKSHFIKIINMSRRFGTGPCVLAGLKIANGDSHKQFINNDIINKFLCAFALELFFCL